MRKRVFALLLICCMLLGLAACGGDGQSGAKGEKVILQDRINVELIYVASEMDFKLGTDVSEVDFKIYGSNIYYPKGQAIVTYSTTERKETVDAYQWPGAAGEWTFERMCYSKSGEVYGLVRVASGTMTSASASTAPYLCKFNTDRNLVFAQDLSEYYHQAGESDSAQGSRLEVGDDGRVYLSTDSAIWIFEADGAYKGEVTFKGIEKLWVRDFQSDVDGNLYVLYEDTSSQNQYVAEIDVEKGAVTAVQQTIGLVGIGTTEEAEQLLGFSNATVYTYNREEGSLTELFQWSECDVAGAALYAAKLLADGRVFTAGSLANGGVENFFVKSIQAGGSEVSGGTNEAGKVNLRYVALGQPSNEVLLAVAQFNKISSQYNVVIEKYGETMAEGIALLQADIESGNAPDLFDVDFGSVDSLVEDGYLEDLSLYLAGSDVISEGDFINFALEEYNYDGILVAIPHRFLMSLLIGNSEFVGEEPGWTMEEMLDFLENQSGFEEDSIFADDCTRSGLIGDFLWWNEDFFVDREAGTCNFDNDIFRRLVQVAADYPAEYDRSKVYSAYTNLQSGKSLLCDVGVSDFLRLQPYVAALGDAMTCIGYPVEEGVGVRVSSLDPIGISALSEYKDGAWEFLEYFLQYKRPDLGDNSFLTYIPHLEAVAEWNLEHKRYKSMEGPDGYKYEYHIPTREEVELCMQLMEVARPINTDTDLTGIITEEMDIYYAGEKSMDEMIASIESRVVQYLQESE